MPVQIRDASGAAALQAGFRTVPLSDRDAHAPLRLCLVVRDKPNPAGGRFLLLRDTVDAAIYLGCTVDTAGTIREWLEVWLQNLDGITSFSDAARQSLSNSLLDQRWIRRSTTLRSLDDAGMLNTGWETEPPPPLFFDAVLRNPVPLINAETGASWEVCRDDALLTKAGLPAYSASLHRYLYTTGPNGDVQFAVVSAGAPESGLTRKLAEISGGLLPFNAGAALMLCRAFDPLGSEEWLQLLSGSAWKGVEYAGSAFRPGDVYRTLQDAQAIQEGGGHLFLGRQGKAGRLIEAFHLKISFLAEAIRLVSGSVKADQLPFLNLTAASFRVRLTDCNGTLPFFYTARTSLAIPSEAVAVGLATTDSRYFAPAKLAESSIYRPAAPVLPVRGQAHVRIRQVVSGGDGAVCEGTLATQEKLTVGRSDLLKLRLRLTTGRLELYGHLTSASERLAPGETRFSTLPQQLSPEVLAALEAVQGVSFPEAEFETLPVLSTPCDLYAIGVLAVRALLVDEGQSLPVALDEALSLARKAAASHDPAVPLPDRIAALVEDDPHWRGIFNPGRLLRTEISDEEAWTLFPGQLWHAALGAMIRLFPGLGPDSQCRDFGDAPALAIEEVFREPLIAFEELAMRSRSLIVSDPQGNQEIHRVIQSFLEGLGG